MTFLPQCARPANLIGRDAELDQALSALDRGVGVALVGPEGVGRTTLAYELAVRLDPRRASVTWLTATAAGSQVPFGTLAALVPAASSSEATVVLPAVREVLRERAGGRQAVLIVDDAHLLDGPSSAVLLSLASQIRIVVSVCAGAAQPDAVTALWKDGYLRRIEVDPFGAADTGGLVAALVGGDVAGPTVQLVHQWTRGNAFYLTELVRAGLTDGSLQERAGLWWWRAPLVVPPTLAELLDRRLGDLDVPAWDALSAVALGEPLAVDVLERLVGSDVVVRLEDEGLLRADDGSGRLLLRFAHPMIGAAIRRRLSPARRRRIAAELLTAAPRQPGSAAETVVTALWQLDAGGQVDGDLLLRAAAVVLHPDPVLALRCTEAVVRFRPSAEASIAHASALAELGRRADARDVLEKAAAEAATAADSLRIAVALAGHRAWAERDPVGGHDELAILLQRTTDPSARCEIRSLDALVQLFAGRARRAADAAEAVLADPAADRQSVLRARLTLAAALTLVGRTEDAVQAGTRAVADAAADSAGLPYARGMALAATAMARIWRSPVPDVPATDPQTGRWPASPERAVAVPEPTAWPLFDGYLRRVAGDLPGAIRCLREALVQQAGGEGLFRSEAAAWLALCLADSGRVDEADAVLGATPPDAVAVVPGLLPWAAAGIAAARGKRQEAIGLMAEAIACARRSGCTLVEAGYLVYEAQIRGTHGPAQVAPRLRAVLADLDAPRLETVAEAMLAVAAEDGDAPTLLRHVDSLERMNLPRSALDVVQVAESRPGSEPATRATAARLRRTWGAEPPGVPAVLTAREGQIAAYAASGLTDREIAERLVLSVRTVESHLARVYRKLGLASRRQLKEALPAGAPRAMAGGRRPYGRSAGVELDLVPGQ
ncbi:MAG TPA: LuxR C-terminal-related transcriptional regulator [Pilimelia sp.]|nr:LuxR C-terminal-related transcriptional regulator [Pilimelia sp.]